MSPDSDELDDISPHVRIRIKPEKKKQWLEYAEEHHQGNLTDLIKEAVDSTIDDVWVLKGDTEPEVDIDLGGLDGDVGEILQRIQAIETQLDDISLQDTGGTANEEERLNREELISLADRCHDQLPLVADGDQLIEISSMVAGIEQADVSRLTGTASDIANAIDESEHRVRQALIFLEKQQNANISSIIYDGIRRWYEVNPRIEIDDVFNDLETDKPVEFESGTEFQ